MVSFFFFNDTATTEIYTLSLHDALPISATGAPGRHSQAHRGLPQGWLAGPDRRTRATTTGARVRIAGGKLTVTDGPFLEAKSRDEALAAARTVMRLHQQHWPGWEGECEIRELCFLAP